MKSVNPGVILWPSFLVAGAATGVFFTVVDPVELVLFGRPFELGRMAAYTIGFFGFWLLGAASSLITTFLLQSPAEVNQRSGDG